MIDLSSINPWAVIAGIVGAFMLGGLWYSLMFGKIWMTAVGITREDVDDSGLPMGRALMASLAGSSLTALGVAILVSSQFSGMIALMLAAVIAWAAFGLSPMLKMIVWEDRPLKLVAIDAGYELASILLIVVILNVWR